MVYIIMGVSGSGKTSVGKKLSEILKIPFYDADDFHNKKNINKMKKGIPLNDADRDSWLSELALSIRRWNLHDNAILACSALRKKYRYKLSNNNKVIFIFLDGSYDLIYQRHLLRIGHFFKESMLKSQFSALEAPVNCIRISIDQSVSDICLSIIDNINNEANAS
jgi:carbohydrate kinase (thermoresistant glucokinase family)